MAIAFGAITTRQTASTGTAPTVTGSNTIGVVFHFGDTSNNLTGITWGAGNNMVKINEVQTPSDRWNTMWYILNPTSGATITCSGGTVHSWFAFYYTGVQQSGVPDATNVGTSSASTSVSVTVNVVDDDCWLVYAQKDNLGGVTYTTDVGTMRANTQGGGEAIGDSNGTIGTGNQTVTLSSGSSSNHGMIGFSMIAAGAAATPTLQLLGVGT